MYYVFRVCEGLGVVLNTIILDYVLIEKYRLIKDGYNAFASGMCF